MTEPTRDEVSEILEKGEVAKPIKECDGYFITNLGSVISSHRWKGVKFRRIRQYPNRNGYLYIHIKIGGLPKRTPVHRTVATYFHGDKPSPQHQVRHLNGVKTDNRAVNLLWGTRSENYQDRIRHGGGNEGSRGSRARLLEKDIPRIFKMRDRGLLFKEIGRKFSVGGKAIEHIISRRTWSHVEIDPNLVKSANRFYRPIKKAAIAKEGAK